MKFSTTLIFAACLALTEVYAQVPCASEGPATAIERPPRLDEANTGFQFSSIPGNEENVMIVTLLYPSQYVSANVSFEGATDDSAEFDNTILFNTFWNITRDNDACDTVLTGRFPWDDFRRSLGGLVETRDNGMVYYETVLNFDGSVNVPVEINPGSGPDQATVVDHTRYVRTKIPIEIAFELEIELSSEIVVTRNQTYYQAVLTETSVLDVSPESDPVAHAEIVVATVTTAPFRFNDAPLISVDEPGLSPGLSIVEDTDLRDCDPLAAYCEQHWRINFFPEVCTLDGVFTVSLTAQCHPGTANCVTPADDVLLVEFEITVSSDDFCGFTQTLGLMGDMILDETECNYRMEGTILVFSLEGGAINNTEILFLEASPTLENEEFVTVWDVDAPFEPPLDFETTVVAGNEVDFSFTWEGAVFRCNVFATVNAVVRVEYEATRDLSPVLLNVVLQQGGQDIRLDGNARIGDSPASLHTEATSTESLLLQRILIISLAGVVTLVVATLSVIAYRKCKQKKAARPSPSNNNNSTTPEAIPTEGSSSASAAQLDDVAI